MEQPHVHQQMQQQKPPQQQHADEVALQTHRPLQLPQLLPALNTAQQLWTLPLAAQADPVLPPQLLLMWAAQLPLLLLLPLV